MWRDRSVRKKNIVGYDYHILKRRLIDWLIDWIWDWSALMVEAIV